VGKGFSAQGETGNRIVSWGAHLRVTGDGHGRRELRRRPFGHRGLAPGFRRLKAEELTPERLTTVAVTRHPELIIPAGNIPVSGFPLSAAATS
jgi:hypothetical protein